MVTYCIHLIIFITIHLNTYKHFSPLHLSAPAIASSVLAVYIIYLSYASRLRGWDLNENWLLCCVHLFLNYFPVIAMALFYETQGNRGRILTCRWFTSEKVEEEGREKEKKYKGLLCIWNLQDTHQEFSYLAQRNAWNKIFPYTYYQPVTPGWIWHSVGPTASSLTGDKSITQYVRRATYSALVLCRVCVSTVLFVLSPLLHQASAFSCHSFNESRNGGDKLDQSWQIMRLNRPVGVKADHLGFSSSLQSLQICPTPLISSEVYTTSSAFSG